MSSLKTLGYSAWGFLGNGVVDTPDGGRSHRLVLLDELVRRGIHVRMLQRNRDLIESREDFRRPLLHFDSGFPLIEALFIEYRWRMPGRNCEVPQNSPAYMPDLDRQNELIDYYLKRDIPIIIWDKDQQLRADEKVFPGTRVAIFEPALNPSQGRGSLLFPINETLLVKAHRDLDAYNPAQRTTRLIYIGNQYDRDESFAEYYDRASMLMGTPAHIYGKWSGINRVTGESFQHVMFHGRVGYGDVAKLYSNAFATLLIAPERYYQSGQYTQRLFEASWQACLPFVPWQYAEAYRLFPPELIVDSAENFVRKMNAMQGASPVVLRNLLHSLYDRLDIFSPARQVDTIVEAIGSLCRPK